MTIRMVCHILAMVAVSAVALPAQVRDADISALLANDDAVASLKQQLASRQISNLDYTRSVQELTKARNAIVARYSRAEQRELTALYRAAVRDKQLAVAEAKRKAAAEAKAQAAAEAQAKKDAAAAAARQVAEEAKAAQSQAMEDDAEEYTRLALRHDELLMHSGELQGISNSEKAEMPKLRAAGDAIKRKYARGGPNAPQSAEFERRLDELSKEKIQPARQTWVATGFPPAATVTAAYFEDATRLAALKILDRLLEEKAGQPQVPATREKLQGYRDAMQKIDTASKGAAQAPAQRLTTDSSFRYEVLHQFARQFEGAPQPPFTGSVEGESEGQESTKRNFYLIGGVAGLLGAGLIYLRFGGRGRKSHSNG